MNASWFSSIAALSLTLVAAAMPPASASPSIAANKQETQRNTQQDYFLLQRCQAPLAQRIGSSLLFSLESLQSYAVSDTETALSGRGNLAATGDFRQFTYTCRVNVRDGSVTRLTYDYTNGGSSPGTGTGTGPISNGTTAIVAMPNGQPLPLRFGAGTEYYIVRSVANGQSITLNGQVQGNWVQTIDGVWAYRPYLRFP